jgi:hypothetical protein
MFADVLGDALDDLSGYLTAHSFRQGPPALVCHFVYVAVRAGKVTTAVHLQNELPERSRPVAGRKQGGHVQGAQRPRRDFTTVNRRNLCGGTGYKRDTALQLTI